MWQTIYPFIASTVSGMEAIQSVLHAGTLLKNVQAPLRITNRHRILGFRFVFSSVQLAPSRDVLQLEECVAVRPFPKIPNVLVFLANHSVYIGSS